MSETAERTRPRRTGGRAAQMAARAAAKEGGSSPVHAGMEGGQYRPLKETDVLRIHEAALQALEVVGLANAPASGVEILTGAGAIQGDDGRIRFPRALVAGAAFALIGSLGLVKLSDFFRRLHGPTKAATLGVGGVMVASMIYFSVRGETVSLHEILITLFVFFTAPVSAHLLVKAAMRLDPRLVPPDPPTVTAATSAEPKRDAPG